MPPRPRSTRPARAPAARGAYTVAAAAFERAARLAPEESARAPLLRAAADAAWNAGLTERAVVLLDEARESATDEHLGDLIEHLRGHATMRVGQLVEGRAILVEAAERAADRNPELAVVMLAEAAHACFYSGAAEEMLSSLSAPTSSCPPGDSGRPRFFASIAIGTAQVIAGDGEAGAEHLRGAMAILDASDELREDPRLLVWAALGPL